MGQAQPRDALAGAIQHVAGNVDAMHMRIGPVMAKRQAGTDTNLQNALGRLGIDLRHHFLAARLEHRAEQPIIDGGITAIGQFHMRRINQFIHLFP